VPTNIATFFIKKFLQARERPDVVFNRLGVSHDWSNIEGDYFDWHRSSQHITSGYGPKMTVVFISPAVRSRQNDGVPLLSPCNFVVCQALWLG